MENFKEIAEKCLAGELSGIFILRNGKEINSEGLIRNNSIYHPYTFFDKPFTYTNSGSIYNGITSSHECDIINFIPDKMTQKKIEIDIPEGKIPVMEQTEKGVVITWKEKEVTCSDVYIDLFDKNQHISAPRYCNVNNNSRQFNKKVEVLRKLINIRNYFGKPDENKPGWFVEINRKPLKTLDQAKCYPRRVIFTTKEHAQAAINMLGDELKYLFEPW